MRTEQEKADALQRRQNRDLKRHEQPTSGHEVNNVVSSYQGPTHSTILVPARVNGVDINALWDPGSADTLLSNDIAKQHGFNVIPSEDVLLKGTVKQP